MAGLTWPSIFRIGLVQTALGAMVVLITSTMNRVMTIELATLASLPGALLALHHACRSRGRSGVMTRTSAVAERRGSSVGSRSSGWGC